MKSFRIGVLVFFMSFFSGVTAQVNLDSLFGVWNDETKADTSRLKAIHKIAWNGYLFSQPDSAFYFAQLKYDFALKVDNKKYMAQAINTQGISFHFKGNNEKALEYFEKSLKIAEEIGDKRGIGNSYNHIGLISNEQGNYAKALEYYEKSLKIYEEIGATATHSTYNNIGGIYIEQGNYEKALEYLEKSLNIKKEIGDKKGVGSSYNNIGIIYKEQGNYEKALEYHEKSFKIAEEIGDKRGIGNSYGNIGIIYKEQGNNEKALEYYEKSLNIKKEIGYKRGIGSSYNNIGIIYKEQGNYEKALEYQEKSLKILEEIGDKKGVGNSYGNIGGIYKEQGNYEKALEYILKNKKIYEEINTLQGLDKVAESLMEVYEKLGNNKKALENHKLYVTVKDSLATMDGIEKEKQRQFHEQYLLEKQADSIKHADEIILHQAEAKTQKQRSNGLALIAVIVILSLVIVFRQLKKVNSQKATIEAQHQKLNDTFEELNQTHTKLNETYTEITDSINYAKRIQDALMTSTVYMKDVIPKSFIYFKPKDVVSGDFYWVYKNPKGQIFFTAVDCTGHGIPGAFMSMIGNSFLNEIIIENKIEDTGQILNNMREQIIKALKQEGVSSDSKDGMDMAICKYDPKKKTVQYSGAYNPLLHISKDEVNLIKADNQPVAYFTGKKTPFTAHEIKVKKGDILYIYSDGFQDQFGGPKGKKYMAVKYRKFLHSIAELPAEEQKQKMEQEFSSWKGSQDQIDDVCVMGVRVS